MNVVVRDTTGLFSTWKSDLPASIVVFLVAVPLCLGIALASGAPLISGVISGIVGGVVVGGLSAARLGVSGPAAGLSVIVLTSIQELGAFDVFLAAVLLAGLVQLALGFGRAGLIAYYFPSAVVTGMLTGIGVIICLKQVPHALGYDRDPEGDLAFQQMDGETTFSELIRVADHLNPGPMLIAAVSLGILIAWENPWFKKQAIVRLVPGPLLAIVAAVVLQGLFQTSPLLSLTAEQLVSIPVAKNVGDYLTFPDFTALLKPAVFRIAVVLAVVASLETLLSVEATDKLDPLKQVTSTNRELKAQGIGNLVSGLLGGLPVTQVIVRSSANIQAGAKGKLSAIVHGLLLVLAVTVLPGVLNRIPLAALAAVLLIVGYKLAKPSIFSNLIRQGPAQAIPFLVTVCGVVFTNLLTGIAMGLAVAVMGLLLENVRLPHGELDLAGKGDGRLRITLGQHVTFLNKASILQALNSIPNNVEVEIDATASRYVHADVVEIIDDFVQGAAARGILVAVEGLEHHQKGHPESTLTITVESPIAGKAGS